MSKKWYNYFVSVDAANPEAAAQTVADIAPASTAATPAFTQPVADPSVFEQIYQAAEVRTPAHGFTIFKIADMLKSEHIRSLPVEIKRSSGESGVMTIKFGNFDQLDYIRMRLTGMSE